MFFLLLNPIFKIEENQNYRFTKNIISGQDVGHRRNEIVLDYIASLIESSNLVVINAQCANVWFLIAQS